MLPAGSVQIAPAAAGEPAKRLRVVILDACRENPFAKSIKRTVAGRSVGRGLGRIEPSAANTLIAFATKPSAIAEDGKGAHGHPGEGRRRPGPSAPNARGLG